MTSLGIDKTARAAGTVQRRPRIPGKSQLKEQAGFLVSRSLTLPSAPPWAGRVIWRYTLPPKKKQHLLDIEKENSSVPFKNKKLKYQLICYRIESVKKEDKGMYQCFIRNDQESAGASAELKLGGRCKLNTHCIWKLQDNI